MIEQLVATLEQRFPDLSSEEMADILFVLICLANQTGVDLTAAFEKNLRKKEQRDKLRHSSNEKLKK